MRASYAHFSADRKYRYLLGRRIRASGGRILFVMLNPSSADETRDDPTIRKCIGFARRWGFGTLEVANLFAYRTAYPRQLLAQEAPIGSGNDAALRAALAAADMVALAWGNHGGRPAAHKARSDYVMRMALQRCRPYHLGLTKQGQPRHPLYVPYSTKAVGFDAGA